MKLVLCYQCKQLVSLLDKEIVTCHCGSVGGKFLSDNITAVVNEEAIVVGIDNNSYRNAIEGYKFFKEKYPNQRVDTFFTGWIPSIPGEVIVVKTLQEVLDYPYEVIEVLKSTMPVSI